jgi:hypothetical protein
MTTFVLLHSPLVSPFTWHSTAAALTARGYIAHVPDLADTPGAAPYWQQHAASAAAALAGRPADEPLTLVAHSGAGPLLPAIGAALARPIAAYLFVDAGWPTPGRSRLDTFGPAGDDSFRTFLEGGGRFPDWSAADLAEIVPDAITRNRLAAELRPRGLDYWAELLPTVPGWPDAPVAYLRFSDSYLPDAAQARAQGWPVRERAAGHFEMLVHSAQVAAELLALLAELEAHPHG